MAQTALLARRDDFIADVENLSLTNFTNGLSIPRGGWSQAISTDGSPVDEVITLRAKGTTYDNLAANIQALDDMIEKANWFVAEPIERYGVWLRAQAEGESQQRQALILHAERDKGVHVYDPPAAPGGVLKQYRLGITRAGWWEAVASTNITGGPANCLGSSSVYSAVPGDVPARLARVVFQGSVGGGGPLYKCWLGLRSSRWGTPANFQSKWECEKGTPGVDTATSTAEDATASGTSPKIMRCTFGTDVTLKPRVTVRMEHVLTSNFADQRGKYLVLLRAKLTNETTTVRMRLLDGWGGETAWNVRQRVEITATSNWNLYEMGVVQIPTPGRLLGDFDDPRSYSMRIEAERVAGTGSLDLDVLILIPYGEGFVYAEGGEVQHVTSPGVSFQPMILQQRPNGEIVSAGYKVSYDGPYFTVNGRVLSGIPVGAGVAVIAGQRQFSSIVSDAVDLAIKYYPRWATLRGSET